MLQKCTFGKNFYFLPLTARVVLNVPLTLLQNNSGLLSQKQKWIAGRQGALEESCYLSMIRYKRFYFVKVPPICLYKTFGVLSVCFQINPVSPHHLVLVQADGHPRTAPLLPAPSSSLPGRKGFFFPIQEVSEFFSSIAWLCNNYRLFLTPKIQPYCFGFMKPQLTHVVATVYSLRNVLHILKCISTHTCMWIHIYSFTFST